MGITISVEMVTEPVIEIGIVELVLVTSEERVSVDEIVAIEDATEDISGMGSSPS